MPSTGARTGITPKIQAVDTKDQLKHKSKNRNTSVAAPSDTCLKYKPHTDTRGKLLVRAAPSIAGAHQATPENMRLFYPMKPIYPDF